MEEVTIYTSKGDYKLPPGSFVQPIDYYYVPKHVVDTSENKWFNRTTDVFCYTHFGIGTIKRDKLRRI